MDSRIEAPPVELPRPRSSIPDDRINILLVDDEPKNLTVLETVLINPTYRLVRADSAEQALMALVSEEFALLVLDIHMPGMSGFELANLIKQREKTAGVPIIFLTAYYSEDQHVLEGYNTGAVDYLHKPINPAILQSKVAVFAELYRKNREAGRSNRELMKEVAARTRAEEQLRQFNDELEERVAERTQALATRERELRSLADNTPDIITRFDKNFRYVFVNAAMERATGSPPEGFIGRTIRDAGVPESLCDAWERSLKAVFATKKPSFIEFDLAQSAGVRSFASRVIPEFGPTGEVEFVLGLTQDVTVRKRAEDALKRADRRKDEFLATLAHELRNPLAPLRSGLEMLKIAQDPVLLREAREMMDRQLTHMVRLIDDLMDASRITNDKLTLRKQRISVQSVFEAAVEASRPMVDAAKHVVTLILPQELLWLDADPTRLAQVVGNLITNAAKYTPKAGGIELAATREGTEAVIRVTDTGLGIPREMLADVFEMFTQVNRTLERSQGGLGVGLALVKRLVELHGGTISAESSGLGQGTTFTVRLPLASGSSLGNEWREPAELAPKNDRSRHRRVLVVDDNVDGAQSLARILRILGHETKTVYTGPEAMNAALDFRPDVVLLDIGLPGMNGYEVAKRIREDPAIKDAMLVALTGWGSEEDKRQSKEAGFDDHLTKPVEISDIERILAEMPRM